MESTDIVLSLDCLPKIGGAHSWLYQVYRRWPAPVSLLTLRSGQQEAEAAAERAFDARDHGALSIIRTLQPVPDINVLSTSCWMVLKQHLAQIRIHAQGRSVRLHALRAFPEGISSWVAKRLSPRRVRLVTYAHGEEISIAGTSRQLAWITRQVYRDSDLIVANSENTRRMILQLCPEAHVVVIHPGVDAAAFAVSDQQRAAVRAEWGWSPQTTVLATVARMEPRKNQAMVLRAIAKLSSDGMQLGYVCAGTGPEWENLRALANDLGIAEQVLFPGAVSESQKKLIFSAADIHIMPSVQIGEMIEGFGIVFLEAAAAGTPSVCGTSGGQLEAVDHGSSGLAVDGRDLASVSEAIRRLAKDPELRRNMGIAGRRLADVHEWDRVAERTLAAVHGLLHAQT